MKMFMDPGIFIQPGLAGQQYLLLKCQPGVLVFGLVGFLTVVPSQQVILDIVIEPAELIRYLMDMVIP
uniref:Uncharacterized protein n=1 Tax=Riboviria sp. TaxID=2585031 RepID=A0A514D3W6_9VIRU|nr:MAG: hypothetical protein H2Rhizo33128_000004 [Riboviria sp.]